jgi:two-component system response regulator FixJ
VTGARVVHVIDDDEAVRNSLAFMLKAAGHVVRRWASAIAFLEARDREAAGCIVTDVRMPDMNGLELVKRLNALGATDPVIVITGHADVPLAVEAMKAGIVDFIEKPFENRRLLGAVKIALDRQASAGGIEESEERRRIADRIDSLSDRERQVLDALVAGHANKQMAHDLGISPRTVEVYRANVMAKMHAGSLPELVRLAIIADPAKATAR